MRARLSLLLSMPIAAALVIGLSACIPPTADPEPEPTNPTHSPSPTPGSTVAPAPTASPSGTPVTLACDKLVSLQAMYDYNANVGLKNDYTPKAGSLGARALELQGIACGWVNQSSGEIIEITVAHPAPDTLAALESDAHGGAAASFLGVDGYFESVSGVGIGQAFVDSYWITASSPAFLSPEDLGALLSEAVNGLD